MPEAQQSAVNAMGLILTLVLLYAGSSGLLEIRIYRKSPQTLSRVAGPANVGFACLLAAGVWRLVAMAVQDSLGPLPGGPLLQQYVYAPLARTPEFLLALGVVLILVAFRYLLKQRGMGGHGGG